MENVPRNISIVSALKAMKNLGADVTIDFVLRNQMSNELLEHTIQAAALHFQDRWISGLPVAEVRPDPPAFFDEMTILRTEPLPILADQSKGEHIALLRSGSGAPITLLHRIIARLGSLIGLRTYADSHESASPECPTEEPLDEIDNQNEGW
jgi:hypothetical protein